MREGLQPPVRLRSHDGGSSEGLAGCVRRCAGCGCARERPGADDSDRGDRLRGRRRRPHGGARRADALQAFFDQPMTLALGDATDLRAGLAARRQAPYRQGPRRRASPRPRHGAEAAGRHHRFSAPWLGQAAGEGLRPEGGQLAGPPGRGDAVADKAREGPCHRPAPCARPADGRAPQPPSRHRRRPGEARLRPAITASARRPGDRDPPRLAEAVPVPRLGTGPHAHRRVVPGGSRAVGLPDAARQLHDPQQGAQSLVVPAQPRLGRGRRADPARAGQPARHALDGPERRRRRHPRHAERRFDRLLRVARLHSHAHPRAPSGCSSACASARRSSSSPPRALGRLGRGPCRAASSSSCRRRPSSWSSSSSGFSAGR